MRVTIRQLYLKRALIRKLRFFQKTRKAERDRDNLQKQIFQKMQKI